MARTPADAALLLRRHRRPRPGPIRRRSDVPLGDLDAALAAGLDGLTVGLCPDLHLVPLAPDVQRSSTRPWPPCARRAPSVARGGAPRGAPPSCRRSASRSAPRRSARHREAGLYPARAGEYGADVRGRLELAATRGRRRLPARGRRARAAPRRRSAALFAEVDLLLTPVGACTAVPIDDETGRPPRPAHRLRATWSCATPTPQDLAGLPACAVRAGFDERGLPVGGAAHRRAQWDDARVLGAAQALFEATPAVQERWPGPSGCADHDDEEGRCSGRGAIAAP